MLVAHQVSLQVARQMGPIIHVVRRHDRDLASQIQRATSSVVLNIGEGWRRYGGDQRRFYQMAFGSAGEVKAALDVAELWGWLKPEPALMALIDRLFRLLYGLTRR